VSTFLLSRRCCCSPRRASFATWPQSAATPCSAPAAVMSAMRTILRAISGGLAPAARLFAAAIATTRSLDGQSHVSRQATSDPAVHLRPWTRSPKAREAVEALDLCARRPIDLQEQPDLDRGRKHSPLCLAQARDAARQQRRRYL